MERFTPPSQGAAAFNCPLCGVYAHHTWYPKVLAANPSPGTAHLYLDDPYTVARCHACQGVTVWEGDRIVIPLIGGGAMPHPDMPANVREDFEEARQVVNLSPRASCALARLALQKLCVHLGQTGDNVNADIAALVQEGLPVEIQQSLDVVRVVGNNAVHPGELDLSDDRETALALFGLINFVVDRMISQPRQIQAMYESLPQGARAAIERRDAS